MTKILLAAHPTIGHTNALRAIGVHLLTQGHPVAMALPETRVPFSARWPEPIRVAATLPQALARDGIGYLPLSISLTSLWYGARLARARGHKELELALGLFTAGMTRAAREIAAHATRWQADVIVGDYLMPAAMLGAALARRPYVALYHSALPFPVEGAPPFGSGLEGERPDSDAWQRAQAALNALAQRFDQRVKAAAQGLGIPFHRQGLLTAPISETLNLLATAPVLEPGLLPLQGPVVMVGPCLPAANAFDAHDPALNVLPNGRPRLYLSLGTVFNNQPGVFNTILNTVSALGFQAIVSAGASFDQLSAQNGADIHLFRRVPQVPLLPTVDVVITHGGNNTVQETLAAGRPMVVIPFGGDQIANARRVERLGVGTTVMPDALSEPAIHRALQAVMQPEVRARAAAMRPALEHFKGTALAAREILAVAEAARAEAL